MTIQHARSRVLHAFVTAALCVLAFGAQANADDGTATPARAIPLARALPRTFSSYDALIATASAVANDQVTLYAHLEDGPLAPTIKAGDIVQGGDRIGAVGLTGMTTGYHLHWAVYRNGTPIDPIGTLGPTAP